MLHSELIKYLDRIRGLSDFPAKNLRKSLSPSALKKRMSELNFPVELEDYFSSMGGQKLNSPGLLVSIYGGKPLRFLGIDESADLIENTLGMEILYRNATWRTYSSDDSIMNCFWSPNWIPIARRLDERAGESDTIFLDCAPSAIHVSNQLVLESWKFGSGLEHVARKVIASSLEGYFHQANMLELRYDVRLGILANQREQIVTPRSQQGATTISELNPGTLEALLRLGKKLAASDTTEISAIEEAEKTLGRPFPGSLKQIWSRISNWHWKAAGFDTIWFNGPVEAARLSQLSHTADDQIEVVSSTDPSVAPTYYSSSRFTIAYSDRHHFILEESDDSSRVLVVDVYEEEISIFKNSLDEFIQWGLSNTG